MRDFIAPRQQATVMTGKVVLWLVLLLAACFSLTVRAQQALAPIPPLSGPVIDTTATLDAATVDRLTQQSLSLQKRKGSQLQVLVIPTTQPEDIAQYSVRAFEQYRIGREKVDDGILLVVAKDDRRVHIEVGYGLEGAIPDATASRVIQEYLVPKFRAGDFAGGIEEATGTLVKLIDGETLPQPMVAETSNGSPDVMQALMLAVMAAVLIRIFLGWLPGLLRYPLSMGAAGFLAFGASQLLGIGLLGVLIGFIVQLFLGGGGGRFAKHHDWGNFPPMSGLSLIHI